MSNEIIPGFDDESDDSLKIKVKPADGVDGAVIFYLSGYIDTYNSNFFQRRITKAIESGYTKLIFHCGGLNYVSSTGIGSFTAFLKAVKPLGGDLVLLEIQPKVYEVFQLLGFSQFFTIKDSLDEAVAHFAGGSAVKQSVFPIIFKCPICSTKLKAPKSGRFRCSNCKTIITIDKAGKVSVG
jgi:anti-sigma B factor antagonist